MNRVPTILYLGDDTSAAHSATIVQNKAIAEKGGLDWWRVSINNGGVTIMNTDQDGEVIDYGVIPFKHASRILDILKENL